MLTIYRLVLAFHIAAGAIGLAAFWTPVLSRKGGAAHVQVGRVFFKATAVVALTGLAMAVLFLIDPLGVKPLDGVVTQERAAAAASQIRLAAAFLAYLVLITFTPVYHGVRVLETREMPERLRSRFHTLVNVAAIVGSFGMIAVAIVARQPVYAALSPIGILAGRGNLRFARRPRATRMAWWYEHMGSMLGGGIAFHTAFLVIGAGRLLNLQLTGMAAVVPWVLPAIVGIPATAVWVGYYRRKFREDGRAVTTSGPTTLNVTAPVRQPQSR